MSFFTDLASGNFSEAWNDVVKAFRKLPQPVQDFVVKAESDLGQLTSDLAKQAFIDVVSGGYTTASFVAAGKDVVAKGAAQGKEILMTDAMAQLNILASSMKAPS